MPRGNFRPDALSGERFMRWRGGDVSRLEGLCDAVFALALTLLVVRLDVPQSFDEVKNAIYRAPVYLACYSLFLWIWYCHFQFHRRYGMEGPLTVALDGAIVFFVLMFALPLRFLAELSFTAITYGDTYQRSLDGTVRVGEDGEPLRLVAGADAGMIIKLYAVGFLVIFLLFAVQTWRAYRQREALELDDVEQLMTLNTMRAHLASAGVGAASLALAFFAPAGSPFAGAVFFLMGPIQGLLGWWQGRGVIRLASRSSGEG